jgi:hypothetical protein
LRARSRARERPRSRRAAGIRPESCIRLLPDERRRTRRITPSAQMGGGVRPSLVRPPDRNGSDNMSDMPVDTWVKLATIVDPKGATCGSCCSLRRSTD